MLSTAANAPSSAGTTSGPTLAGDILPPLRRASARLRGERALCGAAWCVLGIHALAIPWLVLKSVWPMQPLQYVALLLGALVIGAVFGLLRPMSVARAALELDRRLGLNERLQSVLEFASDSVTNATSNVRPTVRALLDEVAGVARTLNLRSAIPLPPPAMARPLRFAALAMCASALLHWLPGLDLRSTIAPLTGGNPFPAAEASTPEPVAASSPEAAAAQAPPPPRLAWDKVEFKDAAVSSRAADLADYQASAQELFSELDSSVALPRLQPSGSRSSEAIPGGAQASTAIDFEPRRSTPEEAAEQLGELEKLWGTPAAAAGEAPNDASETRDQPEELAPTDTPGEEAPDHPVSEEETAEVNDVHPDEERMQQQSNRFSSLPEGLDATSSDLPPWPKAGPGEGKEDESDRDAEGTGRSSGKPGSGFAENRRGRATARIAQRNDEEMRLRGLRQAGREESYETDLPALSTQAQAQLAFGAERSRFTRRAEQALSEDWVPFESREQVKRYFRAIEARR